MYCSERGNKLTYGINEFFFYCFQNEELKERLEAERAGAGHCLMDLSIQKRRMTENVVGLEKEVSELKLAARQTATLNSQLKKAMKHLATCRRKKCSVCAYTKASFGEYAGRNELVWVI